MLSPKLNCTESGAGYSHKSDEAHVVAKQKLYSKALFHVQGL